MVCKVIREVLVECKFNNQKTGYFFFQAEDGIRDLVRSRGLGDVYKRQGMNITRALAQQGIPTAYFSLEMSSKALLMRMVSDLSLIHI